MADRDPIVVVGMGCRLPGGVDSPEAFWKMLSKGRSGWGRIPPDRWNAHAFYHPHPEAKEALNSKHGYFLSQDVSEFDTKFFKVPQYEAHTMDPQQRILLEVAYEALENAGIPLKNLEGSDTSVFVGVYARDYDRMGFKDLSNITKGHNSGVGEAILSNRISYLLDLKGASMTIDTGCSGSLVALHQACKTIEAGESRTAIVGGAELLLHPDQSVAMSLVGLINPEGRCFPFDSRGSGYARGEGVGVVVLKKMSHAIQDGDIIHGVIVNSALNQDGRTAGISFPNPKAQTALIEQVYARVGIDPVETLYVEAHGTGTQVGDNAEIESIFKVFCEGKSRESPLVVGSVKSNIGHLEAASGIASLIKSILVLKKGFIPPNLDFVTPKPSLNLGERNIKVPLELTPLAPEGHTGPRRVSLNSFGYGGTNCHVILEAFQSSQHSGAPKTHNHSDEPTSVSNSTQREENSSGDQTIAPSPAESPPPADGFTTEQKTDTPEKAPIIGEATVKEIAGNEDPIPTKSNDNRLFVLSAASEVSIQSAVKNLRKWVRNHEVTLEWLNYISYTLLLRRSLFSWRVAVVGSSAEQLESRLAEAKATKAASSVNIAFVFTGQGGQWHGMGRELIASSAVFRRSIALSDKILRDLGCTWSLMKELSRSEEESRLGQCKISQPSTTAIQIALVDLLRKFGIAPKGVVGHSSGEIAASYAAGAVSHDLAINIAYHRGLFSALAKEVNACRGAMIAVGASEKAVLPLVDQVTRGRIKVACVNSPESTTVSGDEAGIDELQRILERKGLFNKKLVVDAAYHSHHMQEVADSYLESLKNIASNDCRDVAFYSSVTGKHKDTGFDGSYWTDNLVSKVKFCDALEKLALHMSEQAVGKKPAHVFVEIGPHSVLSGPIKQTLGKINGYQHRYVSALVRNQDAVKSVLAVPALLFQLGCDLNMDAILRLDGGKTNFKVVDSLATYPWDHTKEFWYESRLSRDHRFRQFPPHDLLGLFDVSSNEYEPRWRHHINVKHQPWLKHHVIDGRIIFPGTGYICMAIEALKQVGLMRQWRDSVAKYRLRNVSFLKPIVLKDEQPGEIVRDVETQLVMSRYNTAENSRWEKFKIMSYDQQDEVWTENCTGLIMAEIASPVDEVEGSTEDDNAQVDSRELLAKIQTSVNEALTQEEFYSRFTRNEFGPSFRALTQARLGDCLGSSILHIPDIKKLMPGEYMQPHVIHPTTLDACFHTSAYLARHKCNNSTLMPIFVSEVSITTDITKRAGDELTVASKITPEDKRVCGADIWAFQKDEDGKLVNVIETRGIKVRAVGQFSNMTVEELPFSRQVGYRFTWSDDVDHLSDENLRKIITRSSSQISDGHGSAIDIELYEKAALIHLGHALKDLQSLRDRFVRPNLSRFFAWIEEHLHSEACIEFLSKLDITEEASIIKESAIRGPEGAALSHIGSCLFQIISGKVPAPSSLLDEGMLHQLHSGPIFSNIYAPLSNLLETVAFKNPHMNVLEVRVGTGDATPSLVRAFDSADGLLLHSFDYTDVSKGAIDQAAIRFRKWDSTMSYKVLDILKDLSKQGFEDARYDLVIVHSTCNDSSSLDTMTKNARKLLKPGGRLALQLIHPTAAMNTIFCVLPEWHGCEECRQYPPLISESEWRDMLVRNSFQGIETYSSVNGGSRPLYTTLTARVAGEDIHGDTISEQPNRVHVLYNNDLGLAKSLSQNIGAFMKGRGIDFTASSIIDGPQVADIRTAYLVLDTASDPILANPSAEAFEHIKGLLTTCAHLLWVTFQENDSAVSTAMKGLVSGMARVMRRENPSARFITLDIREPLSSPGLDIMKAITDVASTSFWAKTQATSAVELEYAYTDGKLQIPRVRRDHAFHEWTGRIRGDEKLSLCPYHQADRPLRLEVSVPGVLGSLRFVDDETALLPLPADEIQIEARAYGVNFRDVFVALGQMPGHLPMVGEVSGIVTAVGSDMHDRYKPGDRVMGIGAEPFASQARVKGLRAHVIPDTLDFTIAASIPLVFLTAYHCLVNVVGLEKGQTILIHAASGGVGQAAVQLAQHLGAEIFVTVGSLSKRKMIMDRYAIPENHIFSSRATNFKKGILRMTGNHGVDIVLNSLTGDILSESWECLAPLGTFIEIGKADMYRRNHLSMTPFDKGTSFVAVDLLLLFGKQPRKMHESLCSVMEMLDKGILSPIETVTPMPMGRIEAAFRSIANRTHVGKVVVEADSQAMVQALLPPPPPLNLDPEASYIVVGGLGDIGKRLCQLLARLGAKHIITLSRRNLENDVREAIQDDICRLGAEIHIVKCDITDKSSIESAAALCRDTMPPVKGIIHGGMILRDHPLEKMELIDYTTCLGPKVTGTINLHDGFSSPSLDFFIVLSSVSAILGTAGQSNYAIGNAFQDAFAQAHSGKSHTRYISLNLGAIEDTVAITSLPAIQQEKMRRGSVMMSFEELFKALEYCMGPQARLDGCVQPIFGFDRESMETIGDTFALANPLFSVVAHNQNSSRDAGPDGAVDDREALQEAATLEEASEIVTGIIVQRLATFLGCAAEDIPTGSHVADLGLDSLVMIELQNWVVQYFQVFLQPAEVRKAPSLTDLGKTVASASKFLNKNLRAALASEQKPPGATADPKVSSSKTEEKEVKGQQGLVKSDCCPYGMRKDPLPDLEQSLQDHIANIGHFGTPEQLEELRRAAEDFVAPGSTARKLYAQLVEKSEDQAVDSWIADLYLEARHTRKRESLVFDGYLATHQDSKTGPHRQSEHAALLAATTFRAKQAVEAGTFEPHWKVDVPSCTSLWKWLFNSTREPGLGVDTMRRYEGDYCVVLRRGHMFKVALREGDENVSQVRLEAVFDAIVDNVGDDKSWDGILTSTNRDIWAKNRKDLLALDERNVEYLKVVEEAAFVVCLDDTDASTSEEQVKQGLMGDGFNRWFDKSIQFIVAANGTSAHFVNHSQIDGITIWRLTEWIYGAIQNHEADPDKDVQRSREDIQLEEYTLVTSPELREAMDDYRQQYIEYMAPREYARHTSTEISWSVLEEHKVPIKSVLDLTVQLASRLFFGRNRPSWETLSMSHFHRGRVEMLQLMSQSVAKFCDAVAAGSKGDATLSSPEKRDMLLAAARDIMENKKHGQEGKNFDRLLEALRVMWPQDEPMPALFEDAVFRKAEEDYIVTSIHIAEMTPDSACLERNPEVWWVCYSIMDNK
ncbi:hypothetical protein F4775DRAFT_591035 [Biscogniauxia sp. FL1348]|nr:hypothetical protein F4775DRAFT_591035 [Biscogniauxia sp. FL1348]